MSSRTPKPEKARLLECARRMRGNIGEAGYIAFLESLLKEVDSVSDNKWAMRRWPVPLPSYRAKLGCLNRMLVQLLQEGMDENVQKEGVRARTLAVLLRQLGTEKSVRGLEAEALKAKIEVSMEDMLKRTPEGLETPAYTVMAEKGTYEVREYGEFSVCSFDMNEAPEKAGFAAFNSLAGYIFGKNQEEVKMQMTTPVINHGKSRKMSFIMPSRYWVENGDSSSPPTPMPDSGVVLEQGGGGMIATSTQVAVMWFGGFASKEVVEKKRAALLAKIEQDSEWQAADASVEPLLLQYNDPFVPPWKRRNEVAMPVIRRGSPDAAPAATPAAASAGTQPPPPAKLAPCKAKLEAREVNERLWLNPAAAAPADSTGTQAPPPAKLELCKAKLEAMEVNEKQWLNPSSKDVALKSIETLDAVEFQAVEVSCRGLLAKSLLTQVLWCTMYKMLAVTSAS